MVYVINMSDLYSLFVVSFQDHKNFANAIDYASDGSKFVSGGADGRVSVNIQLCKLILILLRGLQMQKSDKHDWILIL